MPKCPFSGETGEFLSLVKPLSQGNPTVHFGGSEDPKLPQKFEFSSKENVFSGKMLAQNLVIIEY